MYVELHYLGHRSNLSFSSWDNHDVSHVQSHSVCNDFPGSLDRVPEIFSPKDPEIVGKGQGAS